MIWFIIAIITFYILYWFLTKPCLKKNTIDPDHPYRYRTTYKPYGLKIWRLILIILASIIPIVNIISIAGVIFAFFIIKDTEILDWDEIFPKDENYKPNKFIQFLNKDIGKKK